MTNEPDFQRRSEAGTELNLTPEQKARAELVAKSLLALTENERRQALVTFALWRLYDPAYPPHQEGMDGGSITIVTDVGAFRVGVLLSLGERACNCLQLTLDVYAEVQEQKLMQKGGKPE